jgi:glycosyltransferase involved in cell wall biosynthesis
MYSSASPKRPGRIVNVGRFTSEGHCKRQDTLIEAFRRLAEIWRFEDLELHLVGTVPPDARSRGYFSELTRQASGLRVTFHVSASPQKIQELYETSAFYWHATGYGRSERLNPELMEHFGITVMEAMSAGAIPLVYQAGGPAEMVAHGVDGYHWKAVDELVDLNLSLLENVTEATRLRNAGVSAARRFDRAAFDHNLLALLDQVGERSRKPASFG